MKIAFPTQKDMGLESEVYGHFGSANLFIIVDSETGDVLSSSNPDRDHIHGSCQPLKALNGQIVEAVVVGGIGGGALKKLNESGIKVFRAVEGTVSENLSLINNQRLPEFSPAFTCSGHSADGGCAH
jgi:predicted Fe-Mo cluster-binding NifX family protein